MHILQNIPSQLKILLLHNLTIIQKSISLMLFLKELSLYLSLLLQFQLFLQIASALSTIDEVPVQKTTISTPVTVWQALLKYLLLYHENKEQLLSSG